MEPARASLAQLILFERATGRAPPRTGPSQGGAKPLRAVLQRLPVLLAPTYDAKGRPMSGQGRPNGGQWRPTGCQGEAKVGQIDANERPTKASIMFLMKYTALRPGPGSPGGGNTRSWLRGLSQKQSSRSRVVYILDYDAPPASIMFCMKYTALRPGPGSPGGAIGRPKGGQWRPTGCQGEANVGQIDANERPNKASIMFCMKYTALRPGPGSPGGVLMVLWLHVIWFFKPLSRHRPTITDCSTDIRHQQIRWTKVLGSRVYVLVSRVYGFGSRV